MTWHFQTNHKKFQDSRSSYTHSITIYTYMYVTSSEKGDINFGTLVCSMYILTIILKKASWTLSWNCHLPQMVLLCELI